MAKAPKSPRPTSTRKPASKRGSAGRASPPPNAEAAAPTKPSSANPGETARVRGRFYCQGIGDCHLLRFAKDDGGYFWMLIDCGIHSSITGGTAKIKAIVDDIASVTKRLDVIVLTHEHWDHNSGFLAAQDKFKEFSVGEIWMGWTENPTDPQARQLDKFKQSALSALQQASQRLDGVNGLSPHLSAVKQGLQTVLGFNYGAKGEKVRSAREAAAELAKGRIKYLEPTTAPISVPDLAKSIRIYVLGPPRNAAMLGITDRPSEMYGLGLANGWPIADVLGSAFAVGGGAIKPEDDIAAPFDPCEGTDLTQIRSASTTDQHNADIAAFLQDF